MLHDALNRQKHLPLSTSFHASIMQHVHLELHYRHHPHFHWTPTLLPTPIGSTHHLCMKLIHVPTEHTSILLLNNKNVKRCRDGNVCEAYVIPFLFGSFFTVCHPYIDVHFLKCFSVTCKDMGSGTCWCRYLGVGVYGMIGGWDGLGGGVSFD